MHRRRSHEQAAIPVCGRATERPTVNISQLLVHKGDRRVLNHSYGNPDLTLSSLPTTQEDKSVSITELERQIEAVRQEAFADGYAAAMKEVREHTTRATPDGDAAAPNPGERGTTRNRQRTPRRALPSGLSRRGRSANGPAADRAVSSRRGPARGPRRGTNAVLVSEVLKSAAPRALRQAEIRRALQDKGKTMSFPSIGYSLRQLVARNGARQVGRSKTWRYQMA